MSQIFPDFKSSYVDFPMDKNALDTFFKKLDWNYPWNAEHKYQEYVCLSSRSRFKLNSLC